MSESSFTHIAQTASSTLSEEAHAELHSSIFLIICPICGYEPPWSEDMVEALDAT